MKKVLATLVASIAIATTSMADINIQWTAGAGFISDVGGTALLQGGGSVLAQLIFTASGVIGTANDDAGVNYIGTGNDNEYLSSFVMSVAGGTVSSDYGDFSRGPDLYAGFSSPGFVYARIFQSVTPTAGSWYYNSPLIAVTTYDPLNPSSDPLQLNRDLVNGDGVYASAPNNFQVVPEPTTMALLGLGGLLLAIRRRKV